MLRSVWVTALALIACAPALPRPTTSDAVVAAERWPRVTLEELEHGRTLYVKRCAGCHSLKDPAAVAPDTWPVKIAKMQREHDVHLGVGEARLIEHYLYAMSRRSQRTAR